APHRAGSFAKVYSVNASTGDALDVKLTATFDAYLIVTDGAGGVLTTNDTCPGLTGTACVRNVVVPASGIRIEATTAVAGATGSFSLFVTKPQRPGGPGSLSQFMANGSTSIGNGGTETMQAYRSPGGGIALGGPDTTGTIVFKATVSDPDPGDILQIQVERQAAGAVFTGFPNQPNGTAVAAGMVSTLTLSGQPDGAS